MTRKCLLGSSGLLLAASVLIAQQSVQPAAGISGQRALQFAGYSRLLARDAVRKELGFTEEQTQNLQQAFQGYNERQQTQQQEYPDPQSLTEQQRQKFQAEAFQSAEMFGQQLAELLTAEQKEQLEQTNFRLATFDMLPNPAVVQELGLSQEQQQQLNKIREDLQNQFEQIQDQLWKVQQAAARQSMQVLTAEQLTKIRNLQQQAVQQQSRPAAKPQAVRPAK